MLPLHTNTIQTQCMRYQHVTKSPNTDPSSTGYSTIDSSITTWTRIQPNHPSSLGYRLSAIQVKFHTMGINFTKQCICMHNTSMQYSTQVMTTSDIINHHQPQHDIINYHEINHHRA